MFTGIIEEVGKVKDIRKTSGSLVLEVSAGKVCENTNIGDSISVNGVCLTVDRLMKGVLSFEVMTETVSKTNLQHAKMNDSVNLERSMPADGRFSGHFVYGHIDSVRSIVKINNGKRESFFDIRLKKSDSEFIVEKGSIAIDGISLTVGRVINDKIRIFVIPHTLKNTTILQKKIGDYLNIEFDMLGKYAAGRLPKKEVTKNLLKKSGF